VVVEKKKIPSPKEDSVTDLGHNYHHVRAAVRGGRKKKLNASRDRGQYDFYITAIEIGNDRKFNKLHP
jgi:hypothetical protein